MSRIVGLIFSIISAPFLLIASILIVVFTGKNPIFIQKRVGYKGELFNIYKLRTMDDEKVTKIGYYLRKTRLDEFPQFWNMIKGEMRLIGPRPLIPEDYDTYNFDIEKRTQVVPGMTGWAQINGPLDRIEDKMDYDLYYIKNRSIKLDLYILFISFQYAFTHKRLKDFKKNKE